MSNYTDKDDKPKPDTKPDSRPGQPVKAPQKAPRAPDTDR
jgi:hypothetical protein